MRGDRKRAGRRPAPNTDPPAYGPSATGTGQRRVPLLCAEPVRARVAGDRHVVADGRGVWQRGLAGPRGLGLWQVHPDTLRPVDVVDDNGSAATRVRGVDLDRSVNVDRRAIE